MQEENYITKPISVGDKLPNFKFNYYQNGKFHKGSTDEYLKSDKWLILFFYPADFTFICPTELEEMAEHYEKFQAEGAEIISI